MTNGSTDVTRGEFAMLKSEVERNERRLESIDDHGTRGVATVQIQLTEVVKNLGELKADVNARFDAHFRLHEKDEKDRISRRRFTVAAVIAILGSLATILALLVEIFLHVHGG